MHLDRLPLGTLLKLGHPNNVLVRWRIQVHTRVRPTVVATGASNEKASNAENQQSAGGVVAAAGRTRGVPAATKNKTMRRANDAKRTAAATVPSNQGGSAPAESVPKNRNNNQASTQAGDDGNGRENNGKNDTENNDGEGTGNSEVVVAGGACKYF